MIFKDQNDPSFFSDYCLLTGISHRACYIARRDANREFCYSNSNKQRKKQRNKQKQTKWTHSLYVYSPFEKCSFDSVVGWEHCFRNSSHVLLLAACYNFSLHLAMSVLAFHSPSCEPICVALPLTCSQPIRLWLFLQDPRTPSFHTFPVCLASLQVFVQVSPFNQVFAESILHINPKLLSYTHSLLLDQNYPVALY